MAIIAHPRGEIL
ncbi:hypothetical protein CISIN_1g0464282mg, partial [Citrus sinensis]